MNGSRRGRLGQEASLYDVLQIAPWCDADVVHAAYRALARRWHPDLNRGPEAEAQMRRLNAAYQVLSDSHRRARYDRELVHAAREERAERPAPTPASPIASTWVDPPKSTAWAAPPRGGPAFRSYGVAATLPRGVRPAAYIAVVMLSAVVTIAIWLAVDALNDGQLNGSRVRASGTDAAATGPQRSEWFPFFTPAGRQPAGGPGLSDPRDRWNR